MGHDLPARFYRRRPDCIAHLLELNSDCPDLVPFPDQVWERDLRNSECWQTCASGAYTSASGFMHFQCLFPVDPLFSVSTWAYSGFN